MRTKLWISLSTLLLAMPVAAERAIHQDPAPADTAQPESAQDRCDALIEQVQAAQDAFVADYRKAAAAAQETGEDMPAFSWNDSPLTDFIAKFQSAAKEYAGTEDAIPFLLWIVNDAGWLDQDAAAAAIETLCSTHIKSEALEPLAPALGNLSRIVGDERGQELLTLIETTSPLATLQGWATFALVGDTLAEHELDSDIYKATRARLMAAAKKAGDEQLSSQIDKKLQLREVFGLGMTAPDISGTDLDGVAFSLSDYEGKIVFVDFWGDW